MKEISICGKSYPVMCNALTRFHYKKIFGVGIFKDIKTLQELNDETERVRNSFKDSGISDEQIEEMVNLSLIEKLDDTLDVAQRMTYILIYTANKNCGSYEEWLGGIEKFDLKESFFSEVIEIIVKSFC